MLKIKRFKEINEFFETTGFEKRTDIDEFFIFSFEELTNKSLQKMCPYQKDFFQISLIKETEHSNLSINEQSDKLLHNTLYFLSPQHIFSWQRDLVTTGFIVYFKPSFFSYYDGDFESDFSFFDLTDRNILHLTNEECKNVASDFEKLYKEFYDKNTYRIQILQSLFLSLLFKCKSFCEKYISTQVKHSRKQELLFKFKNLVNNCYITTKQSKDYAEKLFISANYLNDLVKEQTGKTAKQIIDEKIMAEAKKQLRFSSDDIAEIAFNLGFDEPTHFIRFFKSHANTTPKAFRNKTDNPSLPNLV